MGTSSLKINGSDEFQEAYNNFKNKYNSLDKNSDLLKESQNIAKEIYSNALKDKYVKSETALGLLKALNDFGLEYHFDKDKLIEQNLQGWIELGLKGKDIDKRKKYLIEFLEKINLNKKKLKLPKKPKLDFKKGDVVSCQDMDGKFVIGFVLEERYDTNRLLYALFNDSQIRNIEYYFDKEPIIVGWVDGEEIKVTDSLYKYAIKNFNRPLKMYSDKFKLIGHIEIKKNNYNCAKGIYIQYNYFYKNILSTLKEFSPYKNYDVCRKDDGEIVIQDNSYFVKIGEWIHIIKPDYKYLTLIPE